MNTWLLMLMAWLIDMFVLGTALLAGALVARFFIRQPAARMALAWGTLLGLAALCVLTALPSWPRQPLAQFFVAVEVESDNLAATPLIVRETDLPPIAVTPLVVLDAPAEAPSRSLWRPLPRLTTVLPLLWLAAATCAAAWIGFGALRAVRLITKAAEAPLWSRQELARLVQARRRQPRLKASERILTAAALGAWRPHILLSARSVAEKNVAGVRAALAHEWAHIRHGDLWLLALERLLVPVFCLHPLFWLLRRQMRIDQELLADAVAAGDAPVEYAQALVDWAKSEAGQSRSPLGLAALSLWENPASLTRRVEMLLCRKSPLAVRAAPFWRWMAPLGVIALVLGLSLLTLRPAAIAEESDPDTAKQGERPAKPKKPKKTKPSKVSDDIQERNFDIADAAFPPLAPQIFLQIQLAEVRHDLLKKDETSLGEIIQEISEDHCRLEGNLIVADLSAEQFSALLKRLKEKESFILLSKPRITTLNGQEASIQVGSQVPILKVETSPSGKVEPRVEYRDIGEKVRILPRLSDDQKHLTLDIAAEQTQLVKLPELRDGEPAFNTREVQLTADAEVGRTLVIAERPRKGQLGAAFPLLAITPQQFIAPQPEVVPKAKTRNDAISDDFLRLRLENDDLRKQVQSLQLKLTDLEVQIQWLRAAATAEGQEKVTDEVFIRRVYLDLTGTLPTPMQVQEFLNDKQENKRDKLIDRLLKSNDYEKFFKKWKSHVPRPDRSQTDAPREGDAERVAIFDCKTLPAQEVVAALGRSLGQGDELRHIRVSVRENQVIVAGSAASLEKAARFIESLESPLPLDEAQADLKAVEKDYQRAIQLQTYGAITENKVQSIKAAMTLAESRLLQAKAQAQRVTQREREVEQARASLETAQSTLSFLEKLTTKGFAAKAERDAAQAEVGKQEETLKQAEAELEQAKLGK